MSETPETSVPSVASEPSASRFRRFWGRDRNLWLAETFVILYIFDLFLLFALATAQQDLFDASLGDKIAISVALFLVFGPLYAAILSGLFLISRRDRADRDVRIAGYIVFAASVVAFFHMPFAFLVTGTSIRATSRLYAKFERAVFDGNADAATKFAQKMEARKNYDLPYPDVAAANARGIALELNGELDASLDVYETCKGKSDSRPARVLYRLGRRADAFAAYCRLAENAAKVGEQYRVDRAVALEAAKRRVLFFEGGDERSALEPFADYAEFLRFVEEEFAKIADPTPFESAVQFWRDAAEIDVSAPAPSLDGSTHFGLTRTPFRFQSDGGFFRKFYENAN